MKKIFLLFCASAVILSCKNDKSFLTDYFNNIQLCELCELSEYPVDSIGSPDFIFSQGNFIVLSEPKLDNLISVYNIETKKISRFLKKGNGPNELLDVQEISKFNKDTLFFVKSTFSKTIFVYSFNDTLYSIYKQIPMPEIAASFFMDNDIIIYTQYGEKRFSIKDIKNDFRVEFGEDISIENCTKELVSQIIQGLCYGNAMNQRFVFASMYGDIFEIYDYKNFNKIQTVASIKGTLPIIHIDNNYPVFSLESKIGIVSITASDKYIYALYNENTIEKFAKQRNEAILCNKILIYDWDGIPQKILKTDRKLMSISYNSKYNTVHCIGLDENSDFKIYYIND
jgi:hypothetical protein